MKERKINSEEVEGERIIRPAKDEIARTYISKGTLSYSKLKPGDMPRCCVLRSGTLMIVKRESTKNFLRKGKK